MNINEGDYNGLLPFNTLDNNKKNANEYTKF